ncbi:NACHT, LRR and PYD domains-containing protein 12-like [Engraulis encrasicolus]|uniref:NACHT, LRR and PYD domains-containing protein 12-like n=1 Tax=Engraulis encrasicolus TaxID=184585 RepID=UPI002FD66453
MSSPGDQESQQGDEPAAQSHSRVSRKGPGSGVSRAPSMRSDWSKDDPPFMAEGESRVSRKEPGSGVSRAPSMRSDWSKDDPPFMAEEEREQEVGYEPDTSSSQDDQTDLLHIFKVLEEKMVTFLKKELQRFKQIFSPDYKETFDMKTEEDSDAREGALKMAMHFLCKMGHQDLADELNENELNVICQNELKRNLNNKYQSVFEGIAKHGSSVLLQRIYTDLYITEGGSGKVNEEHEVRQIEFITKRPTGQDKPIKCADIFKLSPGQDKPVRRVLTKGVAGIGKTISVHKYILDWAEGINNQEINFIFPLCFRELNLMRDKECSLMDLLHHFFPETKQLTIGIENKYNVLFVFDGLDECRLQLNFPGNESLTDVTGVTSLDVLLTNVIKGNLFPSALLWITSRPAAASQIPPECVDLMTEVQGFNNSQKDEYFRKRINDESLASEIISHIKSSRSLHIMCHIPVFCWIAAMVLEIIYSSGQTESPKTLTEMYTHFLIFQTRQRNIKFDNVHDLKTKWNHALVLNLGKLAYEQLEKGNLIFYEEDLRECDIDVNQAVVYSGVCTQIFKEESGIFLGTVFCFVHLSIQEYLAALYALLMMEVERADTISTQSSTPTRITSQKNAVDKALGYEDGRFDLFLRFLLGLSVESNQSLLHGLITMRQVQMDNEETIRYIKDKIREVSSERMINLFHCLNELKDHSLVEEIKNFLNAGTLSEAQLSPGQWSALVFVLMTSDQNLDVFDLKRYIRSDEALLRLKPVLGESHTILVNRCGLTEQSCTTLVSVLCKESSKLRHLDLSSNYVGDAGVLLLCSGLESPNCALETLRVDSCGLTEQSCSTLASVICKESPKLRHLDLSSNHVGDAGVHLLCSGLKSSNCALETLSLSGCGVTGEGYAALASALKSNPSHLEELDLRGNDPGDSGVKLLTDLLQDPQCKLKRLSLSDCGVTGEGYAALAAALKSNPSSHLEELDLRGNNPGDSGVKLLTDLLQDPQCKLKKLRLHYCGITADGCAALISALTSNPSHLVNLHLTNNKLGDSGVVQISTLLRNPHCKLQTLWLQSCSVTEEGCAALASALASNPSSHLTYLFLNDDKLKDSGVKQISTLLRNPHCKLQTLW